jgi:glycosyltransferase involved in cell wall biosynthesis
MRVWIVNQYAVPPTQAGITRHYTLAAELIKRGHDVMVIASSFDHVTRQETRLGPGEDARLELMGKVPFMWLRTPAYRGNTLARMKNMMVFAQRVLQLVPRQHPPAPDVVIGSSPHLFGALAAERLARRYGVPFVLEVRDLWPQSLIDLGGVPAHHPLVVALGHIERYLYREATRILALLPGAADHMADKGATREKVVFLPNGADLSMLPAPEPPPGNDRFTLLYAGTHGLANGLDGLLDAAAVLQGAGWGDRVCMRFVGDGPEKPRLMRRAEAEGLTMVRFEPPVAKELIHHTLQSADAFMVTMHAIGLYRYGISFNKIYDYMAAGRPTVLGASLSNDPMAEAGAGLSVPAGDAAAMAEAIQQLATMSPAERWELGQRGRAAVERLHDFRRLAEVLETTLLEVVGTPTELQVEPKVAS